MLGTLRFLIGRAPRSGALLRRVQGLRRSERLPREELDCLVATKMAALLRVAAGVPYWRGLGAAGLPHEGNSARQVLGSWPILSKAILREGTDRLLNPAVPRASLSYASTGGSTGQPVKVAKSFECILRSEAALLRGWGWAGVRPGDRGVYMKGYDEPSRLGRLRMRLLNHRFVDFRGDNARCGVETIRRFRPRYMSGYPTELLRLADAVGVDPAPIGAVFTTGEMLLPGARATLERAFAGRVFDHYGCTEVTAVAFECPHGTLHVSEERVLVEVVNAAGEPVWDEPGRLLLTDLDNLGMPMIRYEVGDRAVLTRQPCPCGRTLLVLKSVEGRSGDVLQNRQGEIMSALYIAYRFRELAAIKAYQIEQTSLTAAVVRYVPGSPAASVAEAEAIRQEVLKLLGADADVRVEACEKLMLSPFGKTRLVMGLSSTAPLAGA